MSCSFKSFRLCMMGNDSNLLIVFYV
ncbi:hypothetical protein A1UE_03888, partial [Escherichia coli KTE71]